MLADSVGRYLVKVASVLSELAGLGCVLTQTQLGSLFRFSALVDLDRLVSVPAVPPLAATDAHDREEYSYYGKVVAKLGEILILSHGGKHLCYLTSAFMKGHPEWL